METTEKKPDVSELLVGIATACGAIQAMAGQLAIGATTFRFLKGQGERADDVSNELTHNFTNELVETLSDLDEIMQAMGDFLSDCDGVTEFDMKATDSAFAVTASLLRGEPLDTENEAN